MMVSRQNPFRVVQRLRGLYEGFGRDLRIAFRNIWLHPSVNVLVVTMVALGVAGNAALFGVYDGLFLRPLPFAHADRLVDLDETAPQWKLEHVGVSGPDLYAWSRNTSTLEAMAFFRGVSFNLSAGGAVSRVDGAQVTRSMLDVLGLKPFLGRNFSGPEDSPGGANVVLLSYGVWRRVFLSDPAVLGRIIKLDEQPYVVVGVLPRDAVFPDRSELWTPLAADPLRSTGYYVNGIGRLKPRVSIEQAHADLLRIHKAMIASGRRVNEITSPLVTPLRDRYLDGYRAVAHVLLAGVAMVLLIACVNVAALMLVRGTFRSREFAIRAAIGASQGRVVRQLLVEATLLAAIGGVLGVALGAMGLTMVVRVLPSAIPSWIGFSLDLRFAVFCAAITGSAVLMFGLAPTVQASRVDLRTTLQNVAARMTVRRGPGTALGVLVSCETALALTLAIGAGLLWESLNNVLRVNPGFRPDNVLVFRLRIPDATYPDAREKVSYYDNLLGRLRGLPGVQGAGAASAPPLGGQWGGVFDAEGETVARRSNESPTALQVAVTPGYFAAIGMTMLRGRAFEQRDEAEDAPLTAIVNETFASYFWGARDPVGKRIRRHGGRDWLEIVGVVHDEKHFGLDQEARAGVFLPYSTAMRTALTGDERAFQEMSVVLRGAGDPQTLARPASDVVRELDPNVPPYATTSMTRQLDESLWTRRAYSWLFGAFATVAILLAAAGAFGVVSYSVSLRTPEIGVRMALGAAPVQVLGQVVWSGMVPVWIGTAGGVLAAAGASRILRTLLFGVSSFEPVAYAVGVVVIAGIGLLANLAPALRASRVSPLRALHFE